MITASTARVGGFFVLGENDMETYLRSDEIAQRFSVHKLTVLRWVKRGIFPKPIKISHRLTAWPMSVIEAWEKEKIAERQEAA